MYIGIDLGTSGVKAILLSEQGDVLATLGLETYSVERIEENFRALMSECQVSDVRVLADIQPDRVDGVPFLVTCNDAAARPA